MFLYIYFDITDVNADPLIIHRILSMIELYTYKCFSFHYILR